MKKLITFLLLAISYTAFSQGTFSIVDGMNICVKLPASYDGVKKFATIVFMPGAGEIGTNKDLLVKYGPNAYAKMGEVSATVNGVKTEFILVSIQPNVGYPRPNNIKPVIDYLFANYKIDSERFYGTGLSRGGWNINNYALYLQIANDFTYQKTFKAIANVEGQQPDDNFGVGEKYPNGFKSYVRNGGKYLGFEQVYDGRGIETICNVMNGEVPGSATFFKTSFGNGGHCCWDNFYGGNGTQPSKFGGMNIYEWFASLKNGDTVIIPDPPKKTVVSTITLYSDSTYKIAN